MELLLTDSEAMQLIKVFKTAIENHFKTLSYGDSGKITLVSFKDKRNFLLTYRFAESKKVFNFLDCETNHVLFRINLSNNFHRNADGTRISGNRINIFSEQEFNDKQDDATYMKCYPLPFEDIKNSDDFIEIFSDVCNYANIEKQDKINFEIYNQDTLF